MIQQNIRFKDCPDCKGDIEEIVFCPFCFKKEKNNTKHRGDKK